MEKRFLVLNGQVPAQKNQKVVAYNRRTGKPFVMTTPKVKKWQIDMAQQILDQQVKPIEGKCRLEVVVFYENKIRRDLDNSLTSICDVLKNNEIIPDDNFKYLIEETIKFGGIDKENPRAEITITQVEKSA